MTPKQKAAMQAAIDALENSQGYVCASAYTKVRAGWANQMDEAEVAMASLRAALAEPAAEPVVCTNKQAMEVQNSIGLMKNEDERNNYGNHATAIKVLEAFLAEPPPPAKVPMLTVDEIRKVSDKADEGQESTEFMLAFARAIEALVYQKAGLK